MSESTHNLKGKIKYILLLAVAAVFVYFAFRKVNWNEFVDDLLQAKWYWIALFCLSSITALVFRAIRWKELLLPYDKDIKWIKVWDAINVGNLASLALPGSGELLRCGIVSSKKLEYDKVLGTLLCERLCDVIAVAIVFITAISYEWNKLDTFNPGLVAPLYKYWWIIALVLVLLVVFVLVVRAFRKKNALFGRIAESLSRLWTGFKAFSRSENKLLIAASTVAVWIMYIMMCFCIMKSLDAMSHLNFLDAMFFSAIGNFASIIPVPGGVGVYHFLVNTAVGINMNSDNNTLGLVFATLNHEIHAVVIGVLGLFSYLHRMHTRRIRKDTPS